MSHYHTCDTRNESLSYMWYYSSWLMQQSMTNIGNQAIVITSERCNCNSIWSVEMYTTRQSSELCMLPCAFVYALASMPSIRTAIHNSVVSWHDSAYILHGAMCQVSTRLQSWHDLRQGFCGSRDQWWTNSLGEVQGSSSKRELSNSMIEQEEVWDSMGVELQTKTGLASATTTSLVYIVQGQGKRERSWTLRKLLGHTRLLIERVIMKCTRTSEKIVEESGMFWKEIRGGTSDKELERKWNICPWLWHRVYYYQLTIVDTA